MDYFLNTDCTSDKDHFPDESMDLLICDPPFGLKETGFDKHYARWGDYIYDGYEEAPEDYSLFTYKWMEQAKRVMKPDASLFVIIGHTPLSHVLNNAEKLGFHTVNHIIWKYNFGVYTKNKFVVSHYHVLYFTKNKTKRKFNRNCRFSSGETDEKGGKLLYQDMEDVWIINKEYRPGEKKNQNKLPDQLCEKIILYTSDPGDSVCDFFLGNFTTAIVAKKLGRRPFGFELNNNAYSAGLKKINKVKDGERLSELPTIKDDSPPNQGKKISSLERQSIINRYLALRTCHNKKKSIEKTAELFGRGKFSITNIVKGIKE